MKMFDLKMTIHWNIFSGVQLDIHQVSINTGDCLRQIGDKPYPELM